jgi:hypothetical protein
MNRVITYIDGFNLYFGLRSKGWRRHYWLDLHQLSLALLKPGQQLEAVHYFTARIRANGHNVDDMRRQSLYIEALQTCRIRRCTMATTWTNHASAVSAAHSGWTTRRR